MIVLTAHKLGFQDGELFSKKNPFTKDSVDFTKYEEGYKEGLGVSMKALPGEVVLWGTVVILLRFVFEFTTAIQIITLTFIPWLALAWLLSEVMFFYIFASMFRGYIQRTKRGAEAPLV